MEKSKIDRINALARKAKSIGLTERETAERDALRKEYLTDMRASFRQQLDNTYVQTADGAKIPYAEYAKLSEKRLPRGGSWPRSGLMKGSPALPAHNMFLRQTRPSSGSSSYLPQGGKTERYRNLQKFLYKTSIEFP